MGGGRPHPPRWSRGFVPGNFLYQNCARRCILSANVNENVTSRPVSAGIAPQYFYWGHMPPSIPPPEVYAYAFATCCRCWCLLLVELHVFAASPSQCMVLSYHSKKRGKLWPMGICSQGGGGWPPTIVLGITTSQLVHFTYEGIRWYLAVKFAGWFAAQLVPG